MAEQVYKLTNLLTSTLQILCKKIPNRLRVNENYTLTCFEPATSEEVRKLILTSPTKTCALDPISTSLLKSCVDLLLTPITNIVSLSLKSGVFPDTLKLSYLTPLLKKPSLSKDDMKNYRPVSNLNFISKLPEKNSYL